jgi:cell division protein FtsI/penicillin-binding protein 2
VWVPAALFGLGALVIVARLVEIQVLEHDVHAAQARAEQSAVDVLYGRRGAILDRNGNVLAATVDTWDIYVSARAWRDPDAAFRASTVLATTLKLDAAILRGRVAEKGSGDLLVARDVPYQVGKELLDQGLPGVNGLENIARINPDGDVGASLLGFIGADNTGLAGVEASLNDILQGKPGRAIYERDTAGDPIPFGRFIAEPPVPGKDVILTIDRYLQRMAESELDRAIREHRAKGGTIIIMDPHTGEVLALASAPGLKYSTLDYENPDLSLLKNRAVTDLYEPGSIMKVVTAAAAVDAGVVTPDTWYVDTGQVEIGDALIRNWEGRSYGSQSMTGVLQHSINTGSIFMATRLGASRFHDYLTRFGFGKTTGIELNGEAGGIYRRPGDAGWTVVDLATQSFGQAITATPIQMVAAIAAVINGGQLLRPHLVKATVDAAGRRTETPVTVVGRAISEETSARLREMLEAVVNPGFPHNGKPKQYTAGGKSATANVPVINGYDDTQIAAFTGFAPADNPRLVVLVKIDENADLMTGTDAAGPVVARILDNALNYLNVPPDDTAWVEAHR